MASKPPSPLVPAGMETRRPSMPTSIGSSAPRGVPPLGATSSSPPPPVPYRLVDLEGDPAHGVHDLFDPAEVHDHVAVDGDAGKVLDRLGGEVGAAGGEGGVDLVLPDVRYVHERVPRAGEHPPRPPP